jgi:hypothetical protein
MTAPVCTGLVSGFGGNKGFVTKVGDEPYESVTIPDDGLLEFPGARPGRRTSGRRHGPRSGGALTSGDMRSPAGYRSGFDRIKP